AYNGFSTHVQSRNTYSTANTATMTSFIASNIAPCSARIDLTDSSTTVVIDAPMQSNNTLPTALPTAPSEFSAA
ncbi:MAG: hypothetical protein ACKOE4_07575, partial [Candidatus Kapaibacterium sp.]